MDAFGPLHHPPLMNGESAIERKFRTMGLHQTDREALLRLIENEREPIRLSGLLYMFGYSFREEHPIVAELCIRYIHRPYPGATAQCLRVVCDYWGRWSEFEGAISAYLDPSIYEEWYDEVIFAFSFVRNNHLPWSEETLARYATLEGEAERLGLAGPL